MTGGAGFVGSHLVDALVAAGHAVKVADNFSTGFEKNIAHHGNAITRVIGDLAEAQTAREACRDVEYVFHEAAIPSVPRSIEDPFLTQRAGEVVTLRLLEECVRNKVRRVIFAASSSVYGDSPVMPRVETQLPSPLSPYAASKLASEYYMRAYARRGAVDTVSLRYFNVFGPRQNPGSRYAAVIPLFLSRMRQGQAPHIHGDGTQTRDFTYVENVVRANLLAMAAPSPLRGAAFNIGCGGAISLNTLMAELNTILGTKIAATYGPVRAGDVKDSLADITQARTVLGYAPEVNFREGLRRTADAMKSAPS